MDTETKKMHTVHDWSKIKKGEDLFALYGSIGQLNLCQRFFSKDVNKTLEASVVVLQYMIENYLKQEFDRSSLAKVNLDAFISIDEEYNDMEDSDTIKTKKKKVGQPSRKEVLLRDALKILRCHRLVHFEKGKYKLNRELWNKGVVYGIKNTELLSELAPALVRHIRYEVRKTPNHFFETTSKVIGFALKDSAEFNNEYEQTYHVFWQMEKDGMVWLDIDEDTPEEVIPVGITIDENNEKVFQYKYEDSDDIFTATLDKIIIPEEGIE